MEYIKAFLIFGFNILLLSFGCLYAESIPVLDDVDELAEGFTFTEGPAADEDGNVYFTDVANSKIYKWSVENELSLFMDNTGRANGLYFDDSGHLIACVGGSGKLVSIDPNSKEITVLSDGYNGRRFNSLNDLWIAPDGGIYFTDPRYGKRDNLPQDGEHVYYLCAEREKVVRVVDDMIRPNGLVGTADGKKIYIADHGGGKTFSYVVKPDGSLTDKKLFAEQGSDGVTIDEEGNIYLTSDKVNIYDPRGELLKSIRLPQRPSNVTFGGKSGKRLFITARKSLYSIDLPGMGSAFYSFKMKDIDGNDVDLGKYRDKVVLVVNVASRCGFTKQYAGLEKLYRKYKDEGLVVLGFPANNFGNQEPGSDEQIKKFCKNNYDVSFEMFSKISVKGKDIHPFYEYLTDKTGREIGWNFNKILVGKNGRVISHFESKVRPLSDEIIQSVEKSLL